MIENNANEGIYVDAEPILTTGQFSFGVNMLGVSAHGSPPMEKVTTMAEDETSTLVKVVFQIGAATTLSSRVMTNKGTGVKPAFQMLIQI